MQTNSSALEYPRGKRHALTCDPKVARLKNPLRLFNDGRAFNELVPHYFCKYFMTFLLLVMVGCDIQVLATTLKDLSASTPPTSLRGDYFELTKCPT